MSIPARRGHQQKLTSVTAHVEDIVVRNVQKVIPEGIQTWWREYRQAAREMRRERTGDVGEPEVIGHGVAEAEQRSRQEGASEFRTRVAFTVVCG